jgi:hypothetical protein
MAEAITRTRAEVAEIRTDTAAGPLSGNPDDEESPVSRAPRPRDVFAAAERIRDVTWAMRGHGFDPSTCDQLEELAGAILSASALRDPTDHRASKLSEVLQYLEHRIDTLLESGQDDDAPPSEPVHDAFERAATAAAAPINGFAGAFVAEEYALDMAQSEASAETSISAQSQLYSISLTAHDDLDGDAMAQPLFLAVETESRHPPNEGVASEPSTSAGNHGVGAQATAAESRPSVHGLMDRTEAVTFAADPLSSRPGDTVALAARAEPVAADAEPGAAAQAELSTTVMEATGEHGAQSAPAFDRATAALAQPRETLREMVGDTLQEVILPIVEMPLAHRLMLKSPAARATAMALPEAAARTFLPEIDMEADTRDLGAASARGALSAARMPSESLAAAAEPEPPAIGLAADADQAELAGPDTWPIVADRPPNPASHATAPEPALSRAAPTLAASVPVRPAAPPVPHPPRGELVAALKAMSDDELIALFS